LTFTVPSAGNVYAAASGYCQLEGPGLVALCISPTTGMCSSGPSDVLYVQQASAATLYGFNTSTVVPVAAGANTLYLVYWNLATGVVNSCVANLTVMFASSVLP
jgi:hypothetical protein